MTAHVEESELALSASGDLSIWRHVVVRLHTSGCAPCRARVEAFRRDRERLKQEALEMPAEVNWERLAAEMTANIRVGLEAGECVAPRRKKRVVWTWAWHAAAAAAGIILLTGAALWLNFPESDKEVLGKAVGQLFQGRSAPIEDRGPVVEASPAGVELRENGGALKISQGALRPLAVSVSAQGSASARYVDADTGQVTITSVYVQ
ncbi:MAG: hypothetical protein JO307_10370 [Bryobacterales bacterium]|nr:hypothetical protein [Bryobacterales bacterium]MBV9399799.1 hypothetical protein [Bryobacterales bacterium]